MKDADEPWDKMTGAELAHILDMKGHEAALQGALDAPGTDWEGQAKQLLARLGVDGSVVVSDDYGESLPRVVVLSEELRRAALEEGQ